MTQYTITEVLILLVIAVGVGAAIWRGGGRNPVGTGTLKDELTVLGTEVHGIQSKVGEIEDRVEAIEVNLVTGEDIARLESALNTHADEMKRFQQKVEDLPVQIAENRAGIDKIGNALGDVESRQRAQSDKLTNIQSDGAARGATLDAVEGQLKTLMNVIVERGVEK